MSSAEARARRPLLSQPRTRTATPQAVMIHQPGREAATKVSRPLRVHVIGRHLPPNFSHALASEFPHLELVVYDLSGLRFGDVALLAHTSISTMDRLVAPEVLRDVGRAIYLDVDVLVRGDLAELADIDLGETAIAGRDSIDAGWRTGVAFLAPALGAYSVA